MTEAASEAQPVAAPVAEADRSSLIDSLRGVALLGILLMNIPVFAMAQYADEAYKSDPKNVNFWVSAFIGVGFEGKMRALFGMLFGAGVVLFAGKKEKTGRPVAGLFYRRMLWLVVFGLIHAHLILWVGDILYLYGLCGMIVYLVRNVRPAYLAAAVPIVAVLDFTAGAVFHHVLRDARLGYVEAQKAEAEHIPLTKRQEAAVEQWRGFEKSIVPNREEAAENTRKMKSDYSTVASYIRRLSLLMQTVGVLISIWDSLALMFLGVALYRWGFLEGRWSGRAYWWTLLVGYCIGLPMAATEEYYSLVHNPTLEASLRHLEETPIPWLRLLYPCQRILLVLAHVSTLVLLYKAGYAQLLFRGLGAVGRMAFTNYILQSVVCTLVFFGYGLNYYGVLEFYQLILFVFGVWVFQIVFSSLWLQFFLFGPLEWIWRSLVYWKRQPLVRRAAA